MLKMATIDINRGVKVLSVDDDQKLIDVLRTQGIHLPSACGSMGTCGLCKVKMLSESGPLTDAEMAKLSDKERADGIRLSCQVITRGTLNIELPPEFLTSQNYRSMVERKRFLTPDIVELRLKLLSPNSISFLPGQYILLKMPPRGDSKTLMRPFSIASSSKETSFIELNIRLNPEGVFSPWIFNSLQEGQEIGFSGPRGNFYIQNTNNPMLMIAGGSGMAPVRSILKTMADNDIQRKVLFFFGAVSQKDLFYIDEMAELKNRLSDFRFIPALSGEPLQSDWNGERGLITDVVDRSLDGELSQYEAYLCGKPAMIEGCIKVLESKGIVREKTYFDLFNVARPLSK